MPNEGPNHAIVFQFETDYEHLFQQMTSRLKEFVRLKDGQTGSMTAFGLLQQGGTEDITGQRHGETNFIDDPSLRRWAVKRDYEGARMLDAADRLEVLVDLEMGYARNVVYDMNRRADKVIIDAATGAATSGATGTTTATFNTAAPDAAGSGGGNQIAVGASGLTLDKMRRARAVLDAREVGLDDLDAGLAPFVWVTNARGHEQLMSQTETTSTDYIGVVIVNGQEERRKMPLVGGRIPMMMGFRIKIVNQLNLSGVNFINLAWHRNSMGFAIWGGRRMWIGDLPTRHLARGVIVQEHFGAVRIHDLGVLAIVCAP